MAISIHAPRGGSDGITSSHAVFRIDFNPRSPWGERPTFSLCRIVLSGFQSTLPVGGATRLPPRYSGRCTISIHAPRGGSDPAYVCSIADIQHFNPRSPWGERLHHQGKNEFPYQFQSTLPVAGATLQTTLVFQLALFQSTLPVGGATICARRIFHDLFNFNPRSPWGERLTAVSPGSTSSAFQSTLPVGGATSFRKGASGRPCISIHAPRGGSDHGLQAYTLGHP